ncbi:ABC transporter ATP-binding protein [Acidisoma cellulosilytica]|uniref:ABC transporter ATP-binding protein n=1 Tax=Acidisoma cellulosilyticum TaxID=2802395 RepID=A0A963Z6D6_9PROT|nr:ABC transporter ATP-binding protein [Acidisoma cellulosilyticum]MCB8883699.1 ABC transporter ATP-binding protein [Acidisoma cellulosilyticum]
MVGPLLELRGLAKRYGAHTAVHPTSLAIEKNDFFAILGPSGCGKTTLLRMIGGFVPPSEGRILVAGADVTRLPPERRPTGMVFQNYGLFPHMTARQNIAYGLRLRRTARRDLDRAVDEMLALVHLEAFADRLVPQLSGGQRQRVALARALILKPQVLLLDEPLAALDLKLRKAMHRELRQIHQAIGGTFILVSHDQTEVMTLANRVAVMNGGKVVQQGAPRDIYTRPADAFVSAFVGEANILPANRLRGVIELAPGTVLADPGPDQPVNVVIRPEQIQFGPGAETAIRLQARMVDAIFLGPFSHLRCELATGASLLVQIDSNDLNRMPALGSNVTLGWQAGNHLVLDQA